MTGTKATLAPALTLACLLLPAAALGSADRNRDGRVDDVELLLLIDAWAAGTVADAAVLRGIEWWATGQEPQAAWTVMIFMNADNDLETFGIQDMNELERVGSSDQVHLLVQMDRIGGFDRSNGDWTDTRRFRVLADSDPALITSPVLEQLGEADMGSVETARAFIQWAMEAYPARHYLFDFWNHGSGWRGRQSAPDPIRRGVSFDDTRGSHLSTTDLPAILQVEPHIDVVAFDASLMQMMEVVYQIRDHCRVVVGSEESPPGEGYPYHEWVRPLVARPEMSPEQLADLIVRRTVEVLAPTSDVTQSAVRTDRLPALAGALDDLAGRLLATGSAHRDAARTARAEAQHYGINSAQFAEYKDLVDYVERLAAGIGDAGIAAAAAAVRAALDEALIAEAHAGRSVERSHGLSIWVPRPRDFLRRYRELALARDTRWDEWIESQGE